MRNSKLLVFSFMYNAKKIIELEKNNYDDIFKIRKYHFDHIPNHLNEQIQRLYNEIENHFYTYNDVLISLFYKYAFKEKINIYFIFNEEIKKIKKIFTKKQVQIDQDFIIKINQKLKLKNINDFFTIRENGEPIIYELIQKNFISPAFYIKFYKKYLKDLTNQNKDVILKSENYKKFEYAMTNIITIIQGGLDE